MCGILGWIGAQRPREEFTQSLQSLRHRGPDGQGTWTDSVNDVVLGHCRLAIIDLSPSGAQPMTDDTGRWVIVFNGEIYNFGELRRELEEMGMRFHGRSDTEVLLESYKRWGTDCLSRLNGMFAFAIYDKGDEVNPPKLFMARDRAGKKPFYYMHKGGELRFSSELKALGYAGSLDLHALNHYLAFGNYPGELCMLQGIRKLLPGHAAIFTPLDGNLRQWEWWTLPAPSPDSHVSQEALTDVLADLLCDAVRLRLISDVPVGVFLSGGLDSSLVTAAAARVSGTRVKTFTIRVPTAGFDESIYARTVASHFDTEHYELTADSATLPVLDEMGDRLDEPLADSSIIPTYLVSRLTRQHVTVALGGDGGDELFAGYPHVLKAVVNARKWPTLPKKLWRLAAKVAAHAPVGLKGRNHVMSWREGPPLARVFGTPYFDAYARWQVLSPEARSALANAFEAPERRQAESFKQLGDLVYALCHFDFATTLIDDYLVKVDRASMMNSLEVRSPFLDVRLVEFAFAKVPPLWKCDGRETRRLQRSLARRWLPSTLDINRKQGFSVPLGAWLREASAAAIWQRLDGLPAGIFDNDAIAKLIRGHHAGRENASRLFALIMLAMCSKRLVV